VRRGACQLKGNAECAGFSSAGFRGGFMDVPAQAVAKIESRVYELAKTAWENDMYKNPAIIIEILALVSLAFFTAYAPVKTLFLLSTGKNPLDNVARVSYVASACLSFGGGVYALLFAMVLNSDDSKYVGAFPWIASYLFLQALVMAILIRLTRATSKMDKYI